MQTSKHQTDAESHRSPDPVPERVESDADESADDPPEHADDATLSRDDVFGILSNPRRRATIRYLNDHDGDDVQLRDLAEQLAAWENDVDVSTVTYKQRKRVYTSLYQSHLPKMDDLGIVRFDKPRGTVEGTTWTEELQTYLEELEDDGRWERVSIGAASVCLLLLATVAIGPLSLGIGSPVGLAFGLAGTVFVGASARVLAAT